MMEIVHEGNTSAHTTRQFGQVKDWNETSLSLPPLLRSQLRKPHWRTSSSPGALAIKDPEVHK